MYPTVNDLLHIIDPPGKGLFDGFHQGVGDVEYSCISPVVSPSIARASYARKVIAKIARVARTSGVTFNPRTDSTMVALPCVRSVLGFSVGHCHL